MNNELIHYGVKGMHWGVRRYQNYDGTLKKSAKHLGTYYKTKATSELKSMASIGKNIGDAVTGKDSIKKAFKDTKSDISKNSKKTQKAYNTLSKGEKAVTYMVTAASMLIPVGGIGKTSIKTAGKIREAKFINGNFVGDIFENVTKIDDLNGAAIYLKKGTKIKRITTDKFEDYKNFSKLYTTINKQDSYIYKTIFNEHKKKPKFEISYKTLNEIKAPSDKEAVTIFKNLMDSNPEFRKSVTTDLGLHATKSGELSDKAVIGLFNHYTRSFMKNKKATNIYTDEVIKKGFNAVKDYEDSNRRFANTPIIMLDPGNTLIKTGTHKVSNIEKDLTKILLRRF